MPGIRKNPTQRTKIGVEYKICRRCQKNLDVLRFNIYWYQPRWNKIPIGDRERRRLDTCKECVKKHAQPENIEEKVCSE
jgi:hypothetical protein